MEKTRKKAGYKSLQNVLKDIHNLGFFFKSSVIPLTSPPKLKFF